MKSIEQTAQSIEDLLQKNNCVLTMGGEPTYLPFQPEGEEWNQAALGPTKLVYARKLALQLIQDHYQGAILIQTYGKTYPGEPLPRWNIILEFDPKKPLWSHPKLFPGHQTLARPITKQKVNALALSLARRLGFEKKLLTFSEPIKGPLAYALPLRFQKGWQSAEWKLPKSCHQLVEGSSSAGLRLPLDRLPEKTPRTALTLQSRENGIEIFLPPLKQKPYRELIQLIETEVTAAKLPAGSVILCGYLPEDATNTDRIIMASDPGVLEINLPPRQTWEGYREVLDRINTAATQIGLCTHKYHFNGEIQGTGGGSHLTFGGKSVKHSPFLTQPDLLPSIIRYWNNHPVLSYLFTGHFVGPGSQAPRVDESNPLLLKELELSLDSRVSNASPEKMEQLFDEIYLKLKHFFVDAAGNTHRSEICLDKLWNINSPNGKLGIIEFRAFEATPDERQITVHSLLLRAIIARLIHSPYRLPLIQWKETLQDRYFLSPFLDRDLKQILKDLSAHGLKLKSEWFQKTFDHQFPLLGELASQDPNQPIRFFKGLDAWPLLSEVPSGSVTSRPVDVSNERILAVTTPEIAERGYLRAAGQIIPLKKFGTKAIRGIRYRSFPAHLSLHPYLPAHEPLRVEWIDKKSGAVISVADRYSWNPEGKNYTDRPQNEAEALQRQSKRWRVLRTGARKKQPDSNPITTSEWTVDLRQA